MPIAESKRHTEDFSARLKILLQNKTLNSNPIKGFINVTHSHSSAQFNNILSIIPLLLLRQDHVHTPDHKAVDECSY